MTSTFSADSLPNRFDYSEAQPRIYALWQGSGGFDSDPDPARAPFTMVIPPPNVTGALHLGHALNNSLQDILVRLRRMQGYNALWMPGTDHAGIATQAVVERRLRDEERKTRHDLGREALVDRIWKWKEQYEARILGQLQQLGASCDWRRTRFTLDTQCARAVRRTFFDLFRQQLVFRGKRLVNWDTFLQTAVSDDEVFHETVQGHFWHFRYPVINPGPGEPSHVTIATTRPETMLGDTGVAVHPRPADALARHEALLREKLTEASERDRHEIQRQIDDITERQRTLLPELERLAAMARDGRELMLPLLRRKIPLVADEWAKPELGSGCVKITPAHDPNDYDVGNRRGLPRINILNPDGTLNSQAGPYAGLLMADARRRVVADLDAAGLLVSVEDREIDLAHSDRSKTPIEPYLADQWFVRMQDLAQSAMDAVIDGRVKIVPSRYARGYLDWLGEKRDWPVSRQLWWGHQIPVWSQRFASKAQLDREAQRLETEHAAMQAGSLATRNAEIAYAIELTEDGEGGLLHVCVIDNQEPCERELEAKGYVRDPDVLDTWFSSALWPQSTLGWPESTPELNYYYPTSTLITSRDIITLWVARMVLMGLNNLGKVPFHEVYIHPKILDGFGETMSKSKGNGVDPLDVIQKFGADALRFGLAHLTTETQDVRMPVQFECPNCESLIDQTKENRELPRITCDKCGKTFATQWATRPEDASLPRAAVVSERFELARNFTNKLWNAARFSLLGLDGYVPGAVAVAELTTEDRWMLSRLASVTRDVTFALDSYQYADAARTLYDFSWDEFCSFYVEMLKERLRETSTRPLAQRMLAHALDQLLRLLHPMIPFITEDIWRLLGQVAPIRGVPAPQPSPPVLMTASWPAVHAEHLDAGIEARFARFQATLAAIREVRSRQGIPPKQVISFSVRCSEAVAELLRPMEPYFASMAKAKATAWGPDVQSPTTMAQVTLTDQEIFVDLAGLIDVGAEVTRNEKQREKLLGLIAGKEKKLTTGTFVEKAPAEVVAKERASLDELRTQLQNIESALSALRRS